VPTFQEQASPALSYDHLRDRIDERGRFGRRRRQGNSGLSNRNDVIASAAFCVLIVLHLALVWSLPFFPSNDGPVHLYYVDVLKDLLSHSGHYDQYFAIKQFVTPYAFQYYSLIALEQVFDPLTSEKIYVSAYIVLFCLGVRALLSRVAPGSAIWSLVALPFCLHFLVYMGFFNFCFGVAACVALLALWLSYTSGATTGKGIALALGFACLATIHPVPLAVFLVAGSLHLGVLLLRERRKGLDWMETFSAHRSSILFMAAMGVCSILWIKSFMTGGQGSTGSVPFNKHDFVLRIQHQLALTSILPFRSPFYRGGMMIVVLCLASAVLFLLFRKRASLLNGRFLAFLVLGLGCLALQDIAPDTVNSGQFFASRFSVFAIVFLITWAASMRPKGRWPLMIGTTASLVTMGLLWMQWRELSQVVKTLQPLMTAPVLPAGSKAIILASEDEQPRSATMFNPYQWGAVHYLRRSHAVLENAPWLDSSILMLRPTSPDWWSYQDPRDESKRMDRAFALKAPLPHADFIVWEGILKPTPQISSLAEHYQLEKADWGNDLFSFYMRSTEPSGTRSGF
jgi:hypothetical protein